MICKIGLAAALFALLDSSSALAEDAGKIKIGLAIAESGWLAAYDDNSVKMVRMWIDQTNASGGLLGKQIEAVVLDTKSDRAEGAKAGQQLASENVDLMFVSGDYDFGAPAALQAQKAGVISVFLGASDPKAGVAGVGPLSFTTGVAGQVEGAALAEWALARGLKKGFVMLDNSIEYDKSVCAGYQWDYPRVGGAVAGEDTFKNSDPIISSQVTRLTNAIRDEGVDHVMLCSYTPGGASAAKQIRAAGIDVPILAATAMDGTYWLNSVPSLTNFFVPVQAVASGDPRPQVEALSKEFESRYGARPTTQYAYPVYPWLQLWAKAVSSAKTTKAEDVVAQIETYTNEPTILGPRTFSKLLHIQVQTPLTITELSNGKQSAAGEYTITAPIPNDVLYRLNK
jgi:branched-chain amino acid transport system substrate-binding protein